MPPSGRLVTGPPIRSMNRATTQENCGDAVSRGFEEHPARSIAELDSAGQDAPPTCYHVNCEASGVASPGEHQDEIPVR